MTDAYKIGITVALTNLIGTELTQIAKQFGVADKSAAGFGIALGAASVAMLGLTAAMVAGINEARKFQTETAKFALFGMGDKVNRDAQAFAENMKVVGTSATEAMHLMLEAQGVFRESGLSDDQALRGAKMSAPLLAKIDFIGKALDAESASRMHGSAQAMLRFIDMQGGLNDPERFNQIANAGFKAIRSSGGNIDWEQYRQFRARGASAAANLSDEALFGEFEPIIQELKGSTAGFALRTAYNRLNGIIRLPNQAAHELVDIGAWDNSKIQWNSQGGIKKFTGNPLVDSELFARDPVSYYEKYIQPAYAKRGLTQEQITRENALIFGSTGGNLFSIIERQGGAIHRSADSWRKALGIDPSVDVAKETVDGKLVELTAQWATLMKNLGDLLLPTVNSGLQSMINWLAGINKMFTVLHIFGAAKDAAIGAMASSGSLFGSSGVPPARTGTSVPLTVNMHVDGERMAQKTVEVFLNGLDRSPSTSNSTDMRLAPSYAGFGSQ